MRKSKKIFYLFIIVTALFIYKANILNAINNTEHSTVENNAAVDKAIIDSNAGEGHLSTEAASVSLEASTHQVHSENSNNARAEGHGEHVLPVDMSLLPGLVFVFLFLVFLSQVIICQKHKKDNPVIDDSNKKKDNSHGHHHGHGHNHGPSSHAASH